MLASVYFGQALRSVIVALPDGRQARARIVRSSFNGGERAYELEFGPSVSAEATGAE